MKFKKLNFFSSVAVILIAITFPSPVLSEAPQESEPQEEQLSYYEQAKKDLEGDRYLLYRIVDRLARANGLAEQPWQIEIAPDYDSNRFAQGRGLLPVSQQIMELLDGDASALACIVAREMAHHTANHTPITKEAWEQARVQDAQSNDPISAIGRLIGATSSKREKLAERAAQQMVQADQLAYKYSVRAGFEPEGCTVAINLLNRSTESTLLNPEERIELFQAVTNQQSIEELTAVGERNLAAIEPLAYSEAEGRVLINFTSSADDFDQLFAE